MVKRVWDLAVCVVGVSVLVWVVGQAAPPSLAAQEAAAQNGAATTTACWFLDIPLPDGLDGKPVTAVMKQK